MKIGHIAVWSTDIERLRQFYETFFAAKAGERYENVTRGFASYFLSFPDSAVRIELMQQPTVTQKLAETPLGWAHLAISGGDEATVNALTAEIAEAGYAVIGEPRWTGDGYYESVISDPEGNWIETTI